MKMTNKDNRIIILIAVAVTILFSGVCAFFSLVCALICFLMGAVLCIIFAVITKKRIEKIEMLNDYLSLVCSGKYDLDIADNTEGELSILKNNLYKVISLLKTQNEMLKKDKVALADSLADISHQLKTPLTSMMVMTDLLKTEQDSEKRKEFVDVMETQLDKMKWLISTLLKLSKLDAGTADFKKEDFSLSSAFDEVLKPFLITLELKEITLDRNIANITVKGDKSWSVQAIQNIVKNCIEHTEKNGRLSVSAQDTNIYTQVIIKDNGCGIAKEDLPHIFERFYHGKNSSKDSVGIGLAFAKAVLEKENATVTVTSEEGVGSVFEIRFYKSIV